MRAISACIASRLCWRAGPEAKRGSDASEGFPSTASQNFTAVATNPYTQIQKSAPGPPEMMAVATPAMLPVPIDAARAVMNA